MLDKIILSFSWNISLYDFFLIWLSFFANPGTKETK